MLYSFFNDSIPFLTDLLFKWSSVLSPAAANKGTDYANYFQGLWDCAGEQPDELSFKRGDTIYILSKVRREPRPGNLQICRGCHNPRDGGEK